VSDIIATDQRQFSVQVDPAVYSLNCLKKACYAIMTLASCDIQKEENVFTVTLNVLPDISQSNKEIRLLLLDELLDYSLRESISEQTEDVRNVILANAFSRSRLVG
jgi:His-Xaa-Ser system protein HxsD